MSPGAAVDPPAPAPAPSRPAAAGAYLPGDIIAQKYRLTNLLGEGGMGAVWLARNIKLDVDVAIKLIRRELATAETADRLLQEARAAARIGHRSIVRIFDFGETELDDPFIVMEVLTGESLREVLERKGRLPATSAVRTLLPIASALVEAHASGIVHRDLKPENIMLVSDKSGGVVPKLVDFGIAKFRRGDEDQDDASRSMVVGTPAYMSPEQAGGHDEVDEGADTWALAVILYEAITGRVPFAGPTYQALIFAIMTETPVSTCDQLAGDAKLWTILQDGLAKRNVDRPSVRAFGAALAEWAIANGVDSDVAGTSLSAHWQSDAGRSVFSVAPPSGSDAGRTAAEVALPRPGSLPRGALAGFDRSGGRMALTEAPLVGTAGRAETGAPETRAPETEAPETPSPLRGSEPRRRGAVWLAVAGLAAVAVGVAVVLGRASTSPQSPGSAVPVSAPRGEPPVATATSAPRGEPPVATAASTGRVEPPVAAGDNAYATGSTEAPGGLPALATASASAASPAGPGTRPGPRRAPRKSNLPIAKHPNF